MSQELLLSSKFICLLLKSWEKDSIPLSFMIFGTSHEIRKFNINNFSHSRSDYKDRNKKIVINAGPYGQHKACPEAHSDLQQLHAIFLS